MHTSWTRSSSTSLLDNLWHSSALFSLWQHYRWWSIGVLCQTELWWSDCVMWIIIFTCVSIFYSAHVFVSVQYRHKHKYFCAFVQNTFLCFLALLWTSSHSALKLRSSVGFRNPAEVILDLKGGMNSDGLGVQHRAQLSALYISNGSSYTIKLEPPPNPPLFYNAFCSFHLQCWTNTTLSIH